MSWTKLSRTVLVLIGTCLTFPLAAVQAQEAQRNRAVLQFAGGSADRHLWVSNVGVNKGGQLRFWLYFMPRQPEIVRYVNLVPRADPYNVNAQLFEADCNARQQVRRLRNEYYLDGAIYPGATATEEHAETLPVQPRSALTFALERVCGSAPSQGEAATMADARRLSDDQFRRNPPPE